MTPEPTSARERLRLRAAPNTPARVVAGCAPPWKVPHNVMQIGADQGTLMALLVKPIGAKRCIELGTYAGFSALAVALALGEGLTLLRVR